MLQIIFHCKKIFKKKKKTESHSYTRFHIYIVLSLSLSLSLVLFLCPHLLFSLCIGHFIITICLANNVSILQWFIIVDGKCDQMTCVLYVANATHCCSSRVLHMNGVHDCKKVVEVFKGNLMENSDKNWQRNWVWIKTVP